jgi:hypothetical protein
MLKQLPDGADWNKFTQNKIVYLCMSLSEGVKTVVADVTIMSRVRVILDWVLDWILDLLTTLTHSRLVTTLYKSLSHTLSIFRLSVS